MITKDQAVKLGQSGWWKNKSSYEIVLFQLFERKLCMDFGAFHEALEKELGRPVWTHELALNYEGIKKEFIGDKPKPSFEEIMELIPEAKRIVVAIDRRPHDRRHR